MENSIANTNVTVFAGAYNQHIVHNSKLSKVFVGTGNGIPVTIGGTCIVQSQMNLIS